MIFVDFIFFHDFLIFLKYLMILDSFCFWMLIKKTFGTAQESPAQNKEIWRSKTAPPQPKTALDKASRFEGRKYPSQPLAVWTVKWENSFTLFLYKPKSSVLSKSNNHLRTHVRTSAQHMSALNVVKKQTPSLLFRREYNQESNLQRRTSKAKSTYLQNDEWKKMTTPS